LSFALASPASNGTAVVSADGGYVYTPNAAYVGLDGFDYAVSDGNGGVTVSHVEVTVAAAGLIAGTEAADSLSGTAEADVLYGFGGDDTLSGGGGSDVLLGGAGSDRLLGGAGDDVYRYHRGDGSDVIWDHYTVRERRHVNSGYWSGGGEDGPEWVDTSHWSTRSVARDAGLDTLSFGSGIAVADLALGFSGSGLVCVAWRCAKRHGDTERMDAREQPHRASWFRGRLGSGYLGPGIGV
jgi:hypothetical protein